MYVYFAYAIMFIPPIILLLFADIFTLLRHAVFKTMRLSCGSRGRFQPVDILAKNSFSKPPSGQCEEKTLHICLNFLKRYESYEIKYVRKSKNLSQNYQGQQFRSAIHFRKRRSDKLLTVFILLLIKLHCS